MAAQKAISSPIAPDLIAYEPYDPEHHDEPVFEQLYLKGVTVWPRMQEAPLRFDSCKLEQCQLLSQSVKSARIWDSILVRCDLSANKWYDAGLLRTEFLGCRATGILLAASTIKDVSFQNCKLNMANFRTCKLQRVLFENCILDEADFGSASLTDVVFVRCEMNKTDFNKSRCERVDMTLSDSRGIRGVTSLKNVRISPEQLIDLAPVLAAEVGLSIAD